MPYNGLGEVATSEQDKWAVPEAIAQTPIVGPMPAKKPNLMLMYYVVAAGALAWWFMGRGK